MSDDEDEEYSGVLYINEYERHLSNLEHGFDVCQTIGALLLRLRSAFKAFNRNHKQSNTKNSNDNDNDNNNNDSEEDNDNDNGSDQDVEEELLADKYSQEMSDTHLAYFLTDCLPKAVEFILSQDLTQFRTQDVMEYQREQQNKKYVSNNYFKLRDILVRRSYDFLSSVVEMILHFHPTYAKEFPEMLSSIFHWNRKLFKSNRNDIEPLSEQTKQRMIHSGNGGYAECNEKTIRRVGYIYHQLINFFGNKNGFSRILNDMLNDSASYKSNVHKYTALLQKYNQHMQDLSENKNKNKNKNNTNTDDGDVEIEDADDADADSNDEGNANANTDNNDNNDDQHTIGEEQTTTTPTSKPKPKPRATKLPAKPVPPMPTITLSYHSCFHYLSMITMMHGYLTHTVQAPVAQYAYQTVEFWCLNIPFKMLKNFNQSQIHQLLKKLYWIIFIDMKRDSNDEEENMQSLKEEFIRKFEKLRLNIAYRWLQTDSIDKKITAWKEFKEYIDTLSRKMHMSQHPQKYSKAELTSMNCCKDQKSLAIYYLTQKDLMQFLFENNVLRIFLAEDVHEDLLMRSVDVMKLLAWYGYLDHKYIDLLWLHTVGGQESFIQAVYKVVIELLPSLNWASIEHVLQKIVDISLDKYDMHVVSLIHSFCAKILHRAQPQFLHSGGIPQKISEWHCGLKLLWRAMQTERSEEDKHIPLVKDTQVQQCAMRHLVRCLQTSEGCIHQEYIKNLCVENLRCSLSVGTSLQVLQPIINVHPVDRKTETADANAAAHTASAKNNTVQSIPAANNADAAVDTDDSNAGNDDDDDENDNKTDEPPPEMKSVNSFTRETTRSEIIHSLQNQHQILHLIFQDLARYMNITPGEILNIELEQKSMEENEMDPDPDPDPGLHSSSSNNVNAPPPIPPRNIQHFENRFNFLGFLLANSSLKLNGKQLSDLWDIIMRESSPSPSLDNSNNNNVDNNGGSNNNEETPNASAFMYRKRSSSGYNFKLERDHFFKWLRNICPIVSASATISHSLSVDDAVHLFHSKLGCMPRKNMTTNSLECLQKYFDLVYVLATKQSRSQGKHTSGVITPGDGHENPDLSSALNVMWEIAIEAESDTVAESCGVFVVSFYIKPSLHAHSSTTTSATLESKMASNLLSLITANIGGGGANAATAVDATALSLDTNASANANDDSKSADDKWVGRQIFLDKCMEYIKLHSTTHRNIRNVNRCLDLLETFIECTRPGVMCGDLHFSAFDEASSNSSINIYSLTMSDDHNKSKHKHHKGSHHDGGLKELTAADFQRSSEWDLGRYALSNWILPIGLSYFIKLQVQQRSNATISIKRATDKSFTIMINKDARIEELQNMIAASMSTDKGLLQMHVDNTNGGHDTSRNITLSPSNEAQTLESIKLTDGSIICVISMWQVSSATRSSNVIPDGSLIVSQNQLYIEILLALLTHVTSNYLPARVWNLLMRLPFNQSMTEALNNISSYIMDETTTNSQTGAVTTYRSVVKQVQWSQVFNNTSMFQMLYSLMLFDNVLQANVLKSELDQALNQCSSTELNKHNSGGHGANNHRGANNISWLEAFFLLKGSQHLYQMLISFQFESENGVCEYASYRCLYILLKIFASLTTSELIDNEPLFTRAKPRHTTPSIVKSMPCQYGLKQIFGKHFDVEQFGQKLLFCVIQIVRTINNNCQNTGNPGDGSHGSNNKSSTQTKNENSLLAEIIDLALYQFIGLIFTFSGELNSIFENSPESVDLDEEIENNNGGGGGGHSNNGNNNIVDSIWHRVLYGCLFCSDINIRKKTLKHLYQIFCKYSNASIHVSTLQFMFSQLEANVARSTELKSKCLQFFEFYGYLLKFYVSSTLYVDHKAYTINVHYLRKHPLRFCWNALRMCLSTERSRDVASDQYLLGLLKLISALLQALPTLKHHASKTLKALKLFLLNECLFSFPDPWVQPLTQLTTEHAPAVPKCQTITTRQKAFDLLLCICRNRLPSWTLVLDDLIDKMRIFLDDDGDKLLFGWSPSRNRRSSTGFVGLHNYRCTCYLNATMQQLYMNPVVRKIIFGCDMHQLFPTLNEVKAAKEDADNDSNADSDDEEDEEEELVLTVKRTIFYAVQKMMCNLKWSQKRDIQPRQFIANYRDFENNKINVNEQMDAHEFLNFLFDHLERELKGTVAEQMLKSEFCGRQVNQVICQECGYVSETFEPIYAVACKIQNHTSLTGSLDFEYVKGECLTGGNAYRCSKCNKKVTALKRSCFTHLSNTLLVHLKRFEFNLESLTRVKINTKLKFPTVLDMTKYTQQYLDAIEKHTQPLSSVPKYEYQLAGITVHSGSADMGHYYSFIREQNDDGTLGQWINFNDETVTVFDEKDIEDECFGGTKWSWITNNRGQWQQQLQPITDNAYMLVYRRKSIDKRNENMVISDNLLLSKEYSLETLKANGGKRPTVEHNTNRSAVGSDSLNAAMTVPRRFIKESTTTTISETLPEIVGEKEDPNACPAVPVIKNDSSNEDVGVKPANEPRIDTPPRISETDESAAIGSTADERAEDEEDDNADANGGEISEDAHMVADEDGSDDAAADIAAEEDANHDSDHNVVEDIEIEMDGDNDENTNHTATTTAPPTTEQKMGADANMSSTAAKADGDAADLESSHHLYAIAEGIHWENCKFMHQCHYFDTSFIAFVLRFVRQQHTKVSHALPPNRYQSDRIRYHIGCERTKLVLTVVWEIICKFDESIAIPADPNAIKSDSLQKKRERRAAMKKTSTIYQWCEFLKEIFTSDVESAYQFVYLITHTFRRKWCNYLLICKKELVRECLCSLLIHACRCLVALERPLYYVTEVDEPPPPMPIPGIGASDASEEKAAKHQALPPPPPPPPPPPLSPAEVRNLNNATNKQNVAWFTSASVVAQLLDEMCRNILYATHHWRHFNEFWLFFKLFAELGNPEKQLLLDRHLIIECTRFFSHKTPFSAGLKMLVGDPDLDRDDRWARAHFVKYERRKMTSSDSNLEPNVKNMVSMLSSIIRSCAPISLKNSEFFDPNSSDYILPEHTLASGVSSNANNFLQMPSADRRVLGDPLIWIRFLEDNQNPFCLSQIMCHCAWRNNEYSKKMCRALITYLDEWNEYMYQQCFTILSPFLALNDYQEFVDDVSNMEDDDLSSDNENNSGGGGHRNRHRNRNGHEHDHSGDENNNSDSQSYEIKIYGHLRCDKVIVGIIRLMSGYSDPDQYEQAGVVKMGRFLDEQSQTNPMVANYFRIKAHEQKVKWYRKWLITNADSLSIQKKPEFV